ncbi:hypothetical protein [Fodinicurvata fenggangensis]|uniref:hypothetical protein n=1 Tax=Fodinicurvata fenggangensis TaxID=1121830 RepID=UPI00047B147A|nr:hypothetical protein [Fodinicurvata fenggangensis]
MNDEFDPQSLVEPLGDQFTREAKLYRETAPVPDVSSDYGTVLYMPEAIALGKRAADHTVATLEARGQEVGSDHRKAIEASCMLLGRLAAGEYVGKHVIDLPTGAGKTTALVSFVKTLIAYGPPDWSVAIAAYRIEELGDLYDLLTSGDLALDKADVAIWHSAPGKRVPPTYPPDDRHRYQDHRVLLMTHVRLQKGDSAAFNMRHLKKPRNLLIHDESFRSAEADLYSYPELTGALEAICRREDLEQDEKMAIEEIKKQIDQEVESQRKGWAAKCLRFEGLNHDLVDRLQVIARRNTKMQGAEVVKFLRQSSRPTRVLKRGGSEASEHLVQTTPLVSNQLERIAILDASYGVRTLVSSAAEVREKTKSGSGIRPLHHYWKHDPSAFKRFDHITIHYAQTTQSGRNFALEDLGDGEDSVLSQELVHLVKEVIPDDQAVLVVTLKADDQKKVDPSSELKRALQKAGIEPSRLVKTSEGSEVPKVSFLTYGQETATNDYTDYEVAVFLGCLELPAPELVGQYLAESGDLTTDVTPDQIKGLQLGEIQHRLLQAMSRIRMRGVFLEEDDAGELKTQAKASTVYLALRHPKEDLEPLVQMLPGVKWEPWTLQYWGHKTTSKAEQACEQILAALVKVPLDEDHISTKALKERYPELTGWETRTFNRGAEAALKQCSWRKEARGFYRVTEDS